MATKTADFKEAKIAAQAEEISAADRAMSAAMIASGIGSLVLGLAIILSEANADFKTFLTWNNGVGALSGKTGVAVIAFVISWVGLHYFFKNKPLSLKSSFILSVVLVVIGVLLTFPPVFMNFSA